VTVNTQDLKVSEYIGTAINQRHNMVNVQEPWRVDEPAGAAPLSRQVAQRPSQLISHRRLATHLPTFTFDD
jgi:hypothetical protein